MMHGPERYAADRERLSDALRRLRARSGLSGTEAGRRAGMSQPKISKIENGVLLPTATDVGTLCQIYGAHAQRTELVQLAKRLHQVESNRTIMRRGAARQQAKIGQIEAETTHARYFATSVVPGLLQTAEYMRRVFALGLDGTELPRAVTARQQRQQILYDPDKRFTFVLTEAVLRWRLCPDAVMAAQLGHIASLSTLAGVEIGVIPFAAPVPDVPLHGFEMFDSRLVTIGLETATITVTDARDIATYGRLFETMTAAARFDAEARALLSEVTRDYQP